MARLMSVLLSLAILAWFAPYAMAKKTATTPPATQPTTEKSKTDDAQIHKDRAKEFESGKEVDKSKTRSQIDKITGNVSDLEAKLRKSPSTQPTTQPATQPAEETPKKKKKKTP